MTVIHRPLPDEANPFGNVHGGHLMRHMDAVGAIAALRHVRHRLVTAAVEHMSFVAPVKPGEIVHFHASVNAVWHSSMEVGIRAEVEDPYTGAFRHACTCYLNFVGVDDDGRPIPLPPLLPETDEDRRRMGDGLRRMALARMEHKRAGLSLSALALAMLPGEFSVCRLPAAARLPDLSRLPAGAFFSLTCTAEERSLVLRREDADALWAECSAAAPASASDAAQAPAREDGFACLGVQGPLPFSAVGILAALTTLLASARIPVFAVSTYNTDYLLMRAELLEKAAETLRSAGHSVTGT